MSSSIPLSEARDFCAAAVVLQTSLQGCQDDECKAFSDDVHAHLPLRHIIDTCYPSGNVKNTAHVPDASCNQCECEDPLIWLASGCDITCGARCKGTNTCCCTLATGACPRSCTCYKHNDPDSLCPDPLHGCCTKDYHHEEVPDHHCGDHCDCDGERYCNIDATGNTGVCAGTAR